MPAHKVLPENDVLVTLRRKGWTYAEIATHYNVSNAAVYLRLRQANAVDAREDHRELIPWTVATEQAQAHPLVMLRYLSRRKLGYPIPAKKQRMLDKWLAEIKEADVVVCYDPTYPPNPASPIHGGFYYSRRRPSDGNSLIRVEPDAVTR